MKVFITGATGFIGNEVSRRFALTDHEMTCLVRASSNVDELKKLNANLAMGDVLDRDSLDHGMEGCDWVVNLANIYTFWEPDKSIYYRVNVEGTRNVMEAALDAGVSKVVHVSTMAVFGKPDECPIVETSPPGPNRFGDYPESKYQGDCIAWELYEKKHLPLVVIYPCVVTGPNDVKYSSGLIRSLINREMPATAFNSSVMTWVDVRDVAEVIVRATEKDNNVGEKYIAGKEQMKMEEFYGMISDISGVPIPKMRLPDTMALFNARLLTWWANMTKKPPLWNMALDGCRVAKEGVIADGSKAEKELGITYTPIRTTLKDAIRSLQR
ncbi:MAG: NAD-dependent epimerase/dehydratase family protein [Deltaproteobacteria bacterium]|nr:NAD-dependent epimerase/dehydratase family protein [Deltaproteobacteria bacterium]